MSNAKRVIMVGAVWFFLGMVLAFLFAGFSDPEFTGYLVGRLAFVTALPTLVLSYFAHRSKSQWSLLKIITHTSIAIIVIGGVSIFGSLPK